MTQTHTSMNRRTAFLALAIIWTAFFAFGVLMGALGPSLEELAERTNSTLVEIGLISTIAAVGGLAIQGIAGSIIDRRGPLLLTLIGCLLIGIGTFGYTVSEVLIFTLVLALFTGVGHGLFDVSGQMLTTMAFPNHTLRALNSVHLFFGVGAVIGPRVASFAIEAWGTALPSLWLGCILFAISLAGLWALSGVFASRRTEQVAAKNQDAALSTSLYRSPLLWLLGLMIVLYVGAEVGIGNWMTAYMERSAGYTTANAALVASDYWFAFTIGRLFATLIGERLKPHILLVTMLAGSTVGSALLVASVGNGTMTVIAMLVIGFFFGPIYATIMAVATSTFPNAQGKAASFIVATASFGIMTVPWLQGVALERISNAAFAISVLVLVVAMFAAYTAAKVVERSHTPVAQPAIGD